jgi:hypothetical protein
MTRGPLDKTLLFSLTTATALALGGCVSMTGFNAPIDKSSPVADKVAAVSAAPGAYPKWSAFPPAPKDVPTASEFAARAAGERNVQGDELAAAGKLRWTLSGTAAFAAAARAEIDPRLATPAPSNETALAEAFAKAQRDAATPPTKVK